MLQQSPAPKLGKRLTRKFFDRSVHKVAPDLIGATLLVDGVGGVIVEVEAYHHTEPAAHSYNGPTPRNRIMFGPPGFAYVYRSYGIHWCVNFVCEKEGSASAVLIRALAPTHGVPLMRRRRGLQDERTLCSGPGKLCGRSASRSRTTRWPWMRRLSRCMRRRRSRTWSPTFASESRKPRICRGATV
jgi:DNA-3-methyladenine glycosylase